jgi:hypothetical protein
LKLRDTICIWSFKRIYVGQFKFTTTISQTNFRYGSLEDRRCNYKGNIKINFTSRPKNFDEKNFIEPKFNAWVLSNRLKAGTIDIIDETRNLDAISDFDKVVEPTNRIKDS